MFFCAGHLFHVGSRLQHSGKVGVLVSMVFGLTLLLCSCFSRFTVKTLSKSSKTCTCGSSLERTDGRAGARDENARLIVDATCRRVNLMLIMTGTSHLAKKSAPCMVFHSIQTLHAECQMRASAQWNCVCPRAFPLSKVGASLASVMY